MRVEEWPLVESNFDGTPSTMKVVCSVWVGGKDGDSIKILPIDINMAHLPLIETYIRLIWVDWT